MRGLKMSAQGILSTVIAAGMVWGCLVVPAQAQTVPERTITTNGHGEVRVRPDSLSVQVTVESRNPQLATARAENNRKAQAIINALKGLNIPNLKLETQNVQVYPLQGEYQKDRLPKIIGYQVTNSLSVRVTRADSANLSDYGTRIIDTALNAGANNVGGLNFYVDDMTAARTQALELAVKDARGNADAMARAAGVAISGLHSLEGTPQFGGYPRPMPMYAKAAMADSAEGASTPVEVGETTITSDVTARFKF